MGPDGRLDVRCPRPNPGTCEYVSLHSRRVFAAVMKDLELGRPPWTIQGPEVTESCHRGGRRVRVQEGEERMDQGSE